MNEIGERAGSCTSRFAGGIGIHFQARARNDPLPVGASENIILSGCGPENHTDHSVGKKPARLTLMKPDPILRMIFASG